jgi:hypothetical protein
MREDLQYRKMAKDLGWKEHLNVIDENNSEDPQIPLSFTKEDKQIWRCGLHEWGCADLLGDGHTLSVGYYNHRYYKSLLEALTKESKTLDITH